MVKSYSEWNWPRFERIAAQYMTRGELVKGNRSAYEAGRRQGWLDKHFGSDTKRKRNRKHYARKTADDTAQGVNQA